MKMIKSMTVGLALLCCRLSCARRIALTSRSLHKCLRVKRDRAG